MQILPQHKRWHHLSFQWAAATHNESHPQVAEPTEICNSQL